LTSVPLDWDWKYDLTYILTLALSSILLLLTGMVDPGIIPRHTDPLMEQIPALLRDIVEKQDTKRRYFVSKRAIAK